MKAIIKTNAAICIDLDFLRWPKGYKLLNDTIFNVDWSGTCWECKANRFGNEYPNYGDGSIYVLDLHGIEFVDPRQE